MDYAPALFQSRRFARKSEKEAKNRPLNRAFFAVFGGLPIAFCGLKVF
ncbi:MAG: hypothetical protein LBP89_00855 [Helicobacteraceae bacterium]|nr:hypothetical protein [Helicobacteraceae bacterium]